MKFERAPRETGTGDPAQRPERRDAGFEVDGADPDSLAGRPGHRRIESDVGEYAVTEDRCADDLQPLVSAGVVRETGGIVPDVEVERIRLEVEKEQANCGQSRSRSGCRTGTQSPRDCRREGTARPAVAADEVELQSELLLGKDRRAGDLDRGAGARARGGGLVVVAGLAESGAHESASATTARTAISPVLAAVGQAVGKANPESTAGGAGKGGGDRLGATQLLARQQDENRGQAPGNRLSSSGEGLVGFYHTRFPSRSAFRVDARVHPSDRGVRAPIGWTRPALASAAGSVPAVDETGCCRRG